MQKRIYIIIFIIAGLVWYQFFWPTTMNEMVLTDSIEKNLEEKENIQGSAKQLGNGKLAQVPLPQSNNSESADSSFAQALKQCAPDFANETSSSNLIARIYKDYENKNEIESQNIELENIHFLIEGEERRIQILRDVNPSRVEYHYFKLDAEGIPEHLPLPSASMSEWLKNQSATYREERIAIVFKDQSYLQYEVIDNQINDWFWRGPKKSLFCQNKLCVCK